MGQAKVIEFPNRRPKWRQIFEFIEKQKSIGATYEEIEHATGIRSQTVSARLTNLRKQRLIKKSGRMRLTTSGSRAAVYIINPKRPK